MLSIFNFSIFPLFLVSLGGESKQNGFGTRIEVDFPMISQINAANTIFVAVFGFLFNFFTIWMVLRHTQQEMRIYSRILLQTCITDILAICINSLVQPVFFSDNGVGTVWSFGLSRFLPNPWQCLLFMFHVFMMRFSTTSISSIFIYRYLVVKRNMAITLRRYALLLAVSTFPLAILVGSSFFSNCPSAANEKLTNPFIAEILSLENQTLAQQVVTIRANGTKGGSNFTSTFAMGLSICSYLIVIFCGISIHLHIRRRYTGPSMVAKRKVDGQITVVLGVQALLPMLSLLPQLITNIAIRFKLSKGLFLTHTGMLMAIPTTWITVLNPLATLLCVRSYRLMLIKMTYSIGNCGKNIPINLSWQPKPKNTSSEEILEESEGGETLL